MNDHRHSSVTTLGVLPIPPGHSIEVRFYDESDRFASRKEAPVVVDLDAGITYGQHWHFLDANGAQVGTPMALPAQVRADLPVRRTILGRVAATQVTWTTVGHPFPQTTITFEVMSSS